MSTRASFLSLSLLLVACSGEAFQAQPVAPAAGAAGAEDSAGAAGVAGQGDGGVGGSAGSLGGAAGSSAGSVGQPGAGQGGQGAGQGGSAGEGQGGSAGEGQGGSAGEGQGGAAGAGVLCGEEPYSCQGGVLFACEKGFLQEKKTCGAGLCDPVKGDCRLCVPDAVEGCLNETSVLRCDETGYDKVLTSCTGEKPFCSGAKCVECLQNTDCKQELNCYEAICANGNCIQEPVPQGTVAKEQTPNDCQTSVCDGKGMTTNLPDLQDLPLASSDCTVGICEEGGTPAQTPATAGVLCGASGVCNGKGGCGECVPGSVECGGTGGLRTCQENGTWGEVEACASSTPACSGGKCVGVVQLASGEQHSCALLSDGTVRCWGSNSSGQLGLGADAVGGSIKTPSPVPNLSDVVQITCGFNFTCALVASGDAFCWGFNGFGSVGIDSTSPSIIPSPVKVVSESKFKQIDSFFTHSCATMEDGQVACWGENDSGACGQISPTLGGEVKILKPAIVPGVTDSKKVSVGEGFSCALRKDGDVFCWGNNNYGQLADGSIISRHTAKKVDGLPNGVDIDAGSSHVFVTAPTVEPKFKADFWFWGENYFINTSFQPKVEKIVSPFNFSKPDLQESLSSFVPGWQTVSLLIEGFVLNIGRNDSGQLGIGSKTDNPTSKISGAIESLSGFIEVAPGGKHMCARQETGKVWCWGQGSKGQLGHGDTEEHLNPVEVLW